MMQKILKNNKGYTLLFAVLVSSIVLSIGISILTISKKEFLLSASARDSTMAFYAADTGLECATYYNDNGDHFSITTPSINTIKCADYSPPLNFSPAQTYNIPIKIGDIGACAVITIEKNYEPTNLKTRITSKGYNIGWNKITLICNDPSPRRVERALRLVY